jgi:signal transduction histidine kinase
VSLRGRLLIGAVFWSTGLLLLASILLSYAVDLHAGAARTVHGALQHGSLALVAALACMAAGFVYVRRGLASVVRLQAHLAALHRGGPDRLAGVYPTEIQPLVDDLNVLLDERDRAIRHAVEKAADLAHGLKTPLAVLAHEAERAAAAGQHDVSRAIQHQVDRMRRQVDYQLARARAAAPGRAPTTRTDVSAAIRGLIRALERLHAGRGLVFELDVDPSCTVRGQTMDVEEMVGNLLDNACRWARSRVSVSARPDGGGLALIAIDDDGPGLAPALREAVLGRGVRADESGPGSGLGLAIVRDLASLYDGSIALTPSVLGGLRAELRLPA